jgi:hypothetical protein
MSKHFPPVPPASRSHMGTGDNAKTDPGAHAEGRQDKRNLAQQDRQGNISQNTHNQGHQQDR